VIESFGNVLVAEDDTLYVSGTLTTNVSDFTRSTYATLSRLDANGVEQWSYRLDNTSAFPSTFAPDGGILLVGGGQRAAGPYSQAPIITKVSQTGDEVWTVNVGNAATHGGAITLEGDGFAVAGTHDADADFDPSEAVDRLGQDGVFLTRYRL
jgi:hypothetical protein